MKNLKIRDLFGILFSYFLYLLFKAFSDTHQTNHDYLKELIDTHMIERSAESWTKELSKQTVPKISNEEQALFEKRLSNCMVVVATEYLNSNDTYLADNTNIKTARKLDEKFIVKCADILNSSSN